MAKKTTEPLPPDDWTPTQAVDNPILNAPYSEPERHWVYHRKDNTATPGKAPGRRPASYFFTTKKVQEQRQEGLFAEEERDELDLVNKLREDVGRWRKSNYRGASKVTRELFQFWFREDRTGRRPFFCQREAVETIVYLLELAIPGNLAKTGFRTFKVDADALGKLLEGVDPGWSGADDWFPRLVDPTGRAGDLALRRLGCKMATGSGKTVVMAMIITWAFCNRGVNPASDRYPYGVLVCAPNLTVRKRLDVLKPEAEDNYYDAFRLVPDRYRDLLNAGKVLVTNWHAFAPKSENREGDSSYKVVQKGEETPEAFARDRLGDLVHRMPILVLNDEGHHCWRPKLGEPVDVGDLQDVEVDDKKALKEDAEEARVWLAGLDRINNSGLAGKGRSGILATIDLSATPFYLANSGYPEGSPFPWLVSDFGLVDAIESGIVKVPRLPVLDDTRLRDEAGRPDPRYFRLWKHIQDGLKPSDRHRKQVKPDAIYREAESALVTLYAQWKAQFESDIKSRIGDSVIPPVLIVVCNNTDVAEYFFRQISGERIEQVPGDDGDPEATTVFDESKFPLLQNSERDRFTIRIDSDLLSKVETEDGQTRDQAAEALRELIDTVGRPGQPGGRVRCVVSVSMLTEGWDANNVTHILGVRAFGSQLLCEQVVGRGLRRRSYDLNESGFFEPEYVDVYGIPFSLIPYKGKPKTVDKPDPPQNRIYTVPERARFSIQMPVVEGYTYDLRSTGIRCDVDSLVGFTVDTTKEPTEVYLAIPRTIEESGAMPAPDDFQPQTRAAYYDGVRMQQVLFRIAQLITDDLVQRAQGPNAEAFKGTLLARHQVFPSVLGIVKEFVDKKVTFPQGVDKRELAMERYTRLLRERIRTGILPDAASDDSPLRPVVSRFKPYASTNDVDLVTRRPILSLSKSHLNAALLLSQGSDQSIGEGVAINVLEGMDAVDCFTPNIEGRFTIPYEYQDQQRYYEPDFIVRMRGGKHVLLEIKGEGGKVHDQGLVDAKSAAAETWCKAVNNEGRHGEWAYEICTRTQEIRPKLMRHATAEILPFRLVQPSSSKDYFKTCVPLLGLRAAAGLWSDDQVIIAQTPAAAENWVAWDNMPALETDMFIARVMGRSMEPAIPDGSYCLFRPLGTRDPRNRKVLVRHPGIADSESGGQFTVKVYTTDEARALAAGEAFHRIILKPLNPDYEPIVLTVEDEEQVRVLAEVVEVLPLPVRR